jgi:DNA excision repair protein ERCC-3
MRSTRAIAFQRSGLIILDTRRDTDGAVEDDLRRFAELKSAAGFLHNYEVTDISLWAAASSGISAFDAVDLLTRHSSMRVPGALIRHINDYFGRFGRLVMEGEPGCFWLRSDDPVLLAAVAGIIGRQPLGTTIRIEDDERGVVKAQLAAKGYPIADRVKVDMIPEAGYRFASGAALRDYQRDAVDAFLASAEPGGVVILPCGGGKTFVGVAIATELRSRTLIVTPNRTIGEQWKSHFETFTTLSASDVGIFEGIDESKPVNIVTYQALTRMKSGVSVQFHDASAVPWGLVIYDEVHSLPADMFRHSALLKANRKLGLTATLVREDGRESEVYSLVGPPVWQSRWRELEKLGWISPVECFEIRIRSDRVRETEDQAFAAKIGTVERLVRRHAGDRTLIAASRLNQVRALSRKLDAPVVTGETSQTDRSALFDEFRLGNIPALVVSRVANVGVDLPDANVMIQVSGSFGSRQEEAQRLGRLLRPKQDQKPARFYSLVLPDSRERAFAERRQRFLIEQGYRYQVVQLRE